MWNMRWRQRYWFLGIRFFAMLSMSLVAMLLLPLIGVEQIQAQTCPPSDNPDLRCKNSSGNCVRCVVSWGGGIGIRGGGGGIGGTGCSNCIIVNDLFDDLLLPEWLEVLEATRGEGLIVNYQTSWLDTTATTYLVRYYPELQQIEPLHEATISLDEQGTFLDESLGQIPLDAPGGEYRLITCALDDCLLESVLENLDSPDIKMNKFELDYLVQFEYVSATADAQAVLAAPFDTTDGQVSPTQIGFQLYKDNQPIVTTQDFLSFCNPELQDACEASLNLFYPHLKFDPDKQIVEIFAPGTYLKQQNSAWEEILPERVFDTGIYDIQSIVNGVPEDATTIEITTD